MVGIVTGTGLGVFNSSANVLGSAGVLGLGALGQGGRSYVNAVNGNLVLQGLDEQLSGRGTDITLLRTYNSQGLLSNDVDGDGWRWDGERTLSFDPVAVDGTPNGTPGNGGKVRRITGDGHEAIYKWDAASRTYISTEGDGAHDSLEYVVDTTNPATNYWRWTDGSRRLEERYGNTRLVSGSYEIGRLQLQKDVSGNTIKFEYDGTRLKTVLDEQSGQKLVLVYSMTTPVKLARIDTYQGANAMPVKQVEYLYDGGLLSQVKTVLKPGDASSTYFVTRYSYEPGSSRVSKVEQGDGLTTSFRVEFTYEQIGSSGVYRLKTVADANGKQSFTYKPAGTDGLSSTDIEIGDSVANQRTWTYFYDTAGQLRKVMTPAPAGGAPRLVTEYQYNPAGDVIKVIDGRGKETIYEYGDGRGNRTLERDAEGNTITRTFDAKNQLLTQTRYLIPDPDGPGSGQADSAFTTHYLYDGSARLRFIVSPDGRVSETRYGSNGLVERTVQYTAERYTAAFTEADLSTWVSNVGSKKQIQLTTYAYDFRGNLTTLTEFASDDGSGNGVFDPATRITEYIYDGHGALLQTIAKRGTNNSRADKLVGFVYDGLGREISRIEGDGSLAVKRTTAYNDATNTVTVIRKGTGLVVTPDLTTDLTTLSSYDLVGRLINVSSSGNAGTTTSLSTRTTLYVYDAQGRLAMMQDPLGARSFNFYDGAGRLEFTVDRVGSVSRYSYDADGRLIAQTAYHRQVNVAATTDWVNVTSSPPSMRKTTLVIADMDGTGVDLSTTPDRDRISRIEYDAAGRVKKQIDAIEVETVTKYDGASRIVRTETGADAIGKRVTQYFYDRDGRQVGMLDPLGYLTENKYDAGGRLVETIRYNARSPMTPNVAAPVWIGLGGQTAIGNQPFAYRVQALDADGDKVLYSIKSVVPATPAWLTLDVSVDGFATLKGTPPNTSTSYDIVLTASDRLGKATDSPTIRINVTNSAPNWAPIEDQLVAVNTANFSFKLPEASDNQTAASQLIYSIVPALNIPGLAFSGSTVSGRPTAPGTYVITARVADGTGAQALSTERTFVLQVANDGPSWPVPADLPAKVLLNQLLTLRLTAAVDPDGQTLSYSVLKKPAWATFTVNNGVPTLTGTPPSAAADVVELEARGTNGAVRLSFNLNVENQPPEWPEPLPAAPATFASRTFSYQVPRAQDPNKQAVTYSVTGLPPGFTFTAPTATGPGQISGSSNNVGTYIVRLIASDGDKSTVRELTIVRHSLDVPGSAPAVAAAGVAPADPLMNLRPMASSADLHSYFYHDGQGRRIGAVDARGFVTEVVYDEQANTQRTLSYTLNVTATSASVFGNLKAAAGAALTATTEFDAQGRVFTHTDIHGTVTRNEYDQAGRLLRVVGADGLGAEQRSQRTRYNAFGEITGTVGGRGDAALSGDAAIDRYGMHYEYDGAGRRTRAIGKDAAGVDQATLFYYDSQGQLSHTVDALGDISETIYNAFGQVQEQRRYATRVRNTPQQPLLDQLKAGTKGRADLITEIGTFAPSVDVITKYDYDKRGQLASSLDAEGFTTSNGYDAFGQLEKQTRSIKKDSNGTPTVTTTTRYGYDLRGGQTSVTGDLGGANFTQRTAYDAFGRVALFTDAAGKMTRTDYLSGGRVIVVTADLGGLDRKVRTEYDVFNRVQLQYDANLQKTEFKYIDADRSIRVTTPEGVSVLTVKTRFGETLSVTTGLNATDTAGKTVRYEYNKDGQLLKVTDALGQTVTDNIYTESGLLDRSTNNGVVTKLSYDAVNRVLERSVDPDGLKLQTKYDFDVLGRQVRVITAQADNNVLITNYRYDRNGRLIRAIVDQNGLKLVTDYEYDGLGQQISVRQGTIVNENQLQVLRATVYVFDKLQRRIKEIAAPSAILGAGSARERDLTTEYRYDAAGRVSRRIDANGQSTWYVYDAVGELTHTINALGEVSQSFYDVNGRVVQVRRYSTPLDTSSFGDAVGPITPTNASNDRRTYFVHDKDGRQRYVLQAAVGSKWTISETIYDRKSNNVVETRSYDEFIDATRITAIEAGGISTDEVSAELTELYKNATNKNPVDHARRTRFAYDENDRLRFTVDALGSVGEQVYDAGGRVVASVRYAVRPTLAAFDATSISNAVNRANPDNQVTRFAHDAAGRLCLTMRVLAVDSQGMPTRHLVSEQSHDALGRVIQSTAYNTELLSVAGNYSYNNLRDKIKASAADRRSAFIYNAAGQQTYSVQVSGFNAQGQKLHQVVKTDYDVLGQVTQITRYATPVVLSNYSQAVLDTAVVTTSQDRSTRFTYNKVGQQRFVVNADGSFGETVYDALGQVSEVRQFDLRVKSTTPITEAGLSARRAARKVGDGVTRGEKYTYDKLGRRSTTTDALGFVESNQYDGLGNRAFSFDKSGERWIYAYDGLGRVITQLSPNVSVQLSNESAPTFRKLATEFEYDALGNLSKRTEGAGTVDARQTVYKYDLLGRQTTVIQPGWYNPTTKRVEASNEDTPGHVDDMRFQRTLETTYDAFGNEIRSTLRTGVSSFLYEYKTYDTLGRLVHDVDALGNVTGFQYNSFTEQDRLTRYSIGIGVPRAGSGNLWTAQAVADILVADTQSRTIVARYDLLGRITDETQPTAARYYFSSTSADTPNAASVTALTTAATKHYDYTIFGDVVHEVLNDVGGTSGQRRDTWHYFDVMGRETRTVDAAGYQTTREYDATGNLKLVTEYAKAGSRGALDNFTTPVPPTLPESTDNDRITEFVYDVRNLQTAIKRYGLHYANAQGEVVSNARALAETMLETTYDGMGRVRTQTDALKSERKTDYDAAGRVEQTTEVPHLIAGAGADPFLAKITVTPVTRFTRDVFGNVTKTEYDPRSGNSNDIRTRRQGYDFAGNLISTTDANNNTRYRQLDYAGRLTGETQDLLGGQRLERRYAYDQLGRQTEMLDVYVDGSKKKSGQRSVYNAFGEVTEEQRIWGEETTALADLLKRKVATFSYDGAGHLMLKQAADGATHYFYNLAGEITRQEQRGTGTDPAKFRITETGYNARGEAVIQRLPAFNAAFLFANTQDISSKYVMPYTQQGYDRWGNVLTRSQGGHWDIPGQFLNDVSAVTVRYQYDHDNRVTAVIGPAQRVLREDGSSYSAVVTQEQRYDLLGRMVRERNVADDAGSTPVEAVLLRSRSNEYDALGQLTAQVDATEHRTEYVYDCNGNRVGTKNNLGTVFVDTFDNNGNLLSHGLLRQTNAEDSPAYRSGVGTAVRRVLQHYTYDEVNRRTGSVDLMDAAGTRVNRSYTGFDERGQIISLINPSGVITLREYDQFGNKRKETVGSVSLGNVQSWVYSEADDYSVGRLVSSTAGTTTTSYSYTGFGQLLQETDPNNTNNYKLYAYHDNGLLARIEDQILLGTPGEPGGADYFKTSDITEYHYTTLGQVAKERFTRTGAIDVAQVYEDERNRFEQVVAGAIAPVNKTTLTRYDALGRIARVTAPAGAGGELNNGPLLTNLEYSYDELGNIRNISGPETNNWFTYDAEGRMTIADGILENGQIKLATFDQLGIVARTGGVRISYDLLGRRERTEKVEKTEGIRHYDENVFNFTHYRWKQTRFEHYDYNDIDQLRFIHQMVDFSDATKQEGTTAGNLGALQEDLEHNGDTGWEQLEERKYDVRGALTLKKTNNALTIGDLQLWLPIQLQLSTTLQYRDDGQMTFQNVERPGVNVTERAAEYVYDDDGTLKEYKYGTFPRAGAGNSSLDTYTYTYGMEAGGRKQKRIDVSHFTSADGPTPAVGKTEHTYDARGRLVKTVLGNNQSVTTRTFVNDEQGRVLFTQEIKKATNAADQVGQQGSFYAAGRQVGTIGTGTLAGTHLSLGYTPITEGIATPDSYTVRSNDSLAGIAFEVYGDRALWYLIADANSIASAPDAALPPSEVGKPYRIPKTVGSHNNAGTFKPYDPQGAANGLTLASAGPGQCIGIRHTLAVLAVMVVSTLVEYGVRYVATPYVGPVIGGALGNAAGNLSGQFVGTQLGLQERINWDQLQMAAFQGAFQGAISKVGAGDALDSPILKSTIASFGATSAKQLGNPFADTGGIGSVFERGAEIAAGAIGANLGKEYSPYAAAAGRLFNDIFNPETGYAFNAKQRNWDTFATRTFNAARGLLFELAIDRAQEASKKSGARRAGSQSVFNGASSATTANGPIVIDAISGGAIGGGRTLDGAVDDSAVLGLSRPEGVGAYLGAETMSDGTVVHRWATTNGTATATYWAEGEMPNRATGVPIRPYRYFLGEDTSPYAEIDLKGNLSYVYPISAPPESDAYAFTESPESMQWIKAQAAYANFKDVLARPNGVYGIEEHSGYPEAIPNFRARWDQWIDHITPEQRELLLKRDESFRLHDEAFARYWQRVPGKTQTYSEAREQSRREEEQWLNTVGQPTRPGDPLIMGPDGSTYYKSQIPGIINHRLAMAALNAGNIGVIGLGVGIATEVEQRVRGVPGNEIGSVLLGRLDMVAPLDGALGAVGGAYLHANAAMVELNAQFQLDAFVASLPGRGSVPGAGAAAIGTELPAAAPDNSAPRPGQLLLAPVVTQYAFRGSGKPEILLEDNPPHPYIYTGHVGYGFGDGKIYGFGPRVDVGAYEAVTSLRGGQRYPGVVADDTQIFNRVHDNPLIARGERILGRTEDGVLQQVYEVTTQVHDLQQWQRLVDAHQNFGVGVPSASVNYSFSTVPELSCFNCATFPQVIGVPVLEPTGQISAVIRTIQAQGVPWFGFRR